MAAQSSVPVGLTGLKLLHQIFSLVQREQNHHMTMCVHAVTLSRVRLHAGAVGWCLSLSPYSSEMFAHNSVQTEHVSAEKHEYARCMNIVVAI